MKNMITVSRKNKRSCQVKSNEMISRQAAEMYDVPYITLQRRVTPYVSTSPENK